MRRSSINGSHRHAVRTAIGIAAGSLLSLQAAAQSEPLKPLPAPVFAASPAAAPAALPPVVGSPVTPPSAATADKLDAAAAPVTVNRVPAFTPPQTATAAAPPPIAKPPMAAALPAPVAMPAPTATLPAPVAPPAQAAMPAAAAKPATVSKQALAPPVPGAASAAAIPRLNRDDDKVSDAHSRPHPIAMAHPGFEVIVCLAGCGAEGVRAVSVQKPKSLMPQTGRLIQVAQVVSDVRVNQAALPECLAGCYEPAPRSGRPAEAGTAAAAVRMPAAPVGATDRSVMVQTSAPLGSPTATQSKPKTPVTAKDGAKKRTGSEWFTRRFDKQPVANRL
jgi:hypothetical protein